MPTHHVSPLSAASHYLASAQFWENRAKSLQGLVDAQDAEITSLRERLAAHEPPETSAHPELDPAAA